MPDVTSPTPPAASEKKPRGPYAKNDSRAAAEINAARRLLRTAGTDPDIVPVALAHGVDAAEIAAADALVEEAARKWGVRLEGMAAEDELVDETLLACQAVRTDYLKYREIGRANFPAEADRVALGLGGELPDTFDVLAVQIVAAYQTAKKPAYTALMTKRGYGPARLDALIAAVEDLTDDETDQTEAEGDAMKTTEARDAALAAMKAAMKPIRGTLRGALRGQPALLAKLDL